MSIYVVKKSTRADWAESRPFLIKKEDLYEGVWITSGYALADENGTMTELEAEKISCALRDKIEKEEMDAYHTLVDEAQDVADALGFNLSLCDVQNEDKPVSVAEYPVIILFSDTEYGEVCRTADMHSEDFCLYLDNGCKWKTLELTSGHEAELDCSDDYVNIDEWEGHWDGRYTMQKFTHVRIYKALGEQAVWVAVISSQMDRGPDHAEVITGKTELAAFLEEVEREDYLKAVLEL